MIFFPDRSYSVELAKLNEQLEAYDVAARKKKQQQKISPREMELLTDKDLIVLAQKRQFLFQKYVDTLGEARAHPSLRIRETIRNLFESYRITNPEEAWDRLAGSQGLSLDAYEYLLLKDAPESSFDAWRAIRHPDGKIPREKLDAAKAVMLWLSDYPVPAGAAYCKKYLYHSDAELRVAAARALFVFGDASVSESAPMLFQIARNSRNSEGLRLAAVEVLESLGKGESIHALTLELFEAFKARVASAESKPALFEAARDAFRAAHVLKRLDIAVDEKSLIQDFLARQESSLDEFAPSLLTPVIQWYGQLVGEEGLREMAGDPGVPLEIRLQSSFLLGSFPELQLKRNPEVKVDSRQEDPDWLAALQAVSYEQVAKMIQEEGTRQSFLNLTQEYKLLSPDFDWKNFKPEAGSTFFLVGLQIAQVTLNLHTESKISKEGKLAMMRAMPAEAIKILGDAAATCHHVAITTLILLDHYGNPRALPFLLALDVRPLLLEAKRQDREAVMILRTLASLGHHQAALSPYTKPKKANPN